MNNSQPFSGIHATSYDYYCRLISPLRAVAKEYGYVLNVQGDVGKGINLVAVPWAKQPTPIEALVKALVAVCQKLVQRGHLHSEEAGQSEQHETPCWTIHLDNGIYIDLSVIRLRLV